MHSVPQIMDVNIHDYFLKMTTVGVYWPMHGPLGEDASFIYPKFQTLGVADGVSSWRKQGIDSGEYARQLMANSVLALSNESPGNINPKRVLQEAFTATKARGSSTACVVALSGDKLRAANVGDSGFLVIRNDAVLFRSRAQQKRFNFPFQLGTTRDDPSVAEVVGVAVRRGDVVVVGTDGLLDNLHESEIVGIAGNSKIRDDNELLRQADCLVDAAAGNSRDPERESPFSIEASKAGVRHRGGKPDDVTVIIARIHD